MNILFAYDGSDEADAAISAAAALLQPNGGKAVVLSVWEPLTVQALRAEKFGGPLAFPLSADEFDKPSEDHARQVAEQGAQVAKEHGFDVQALSVADKHAIADTIVTRADELDVDVIVLGARGLAGIAAFLGSVSNHVLQHAHRPVLIVPPKEARNG